MTLLVAGGASAQEGTVAAPPAAAPAAGAPQPAFANLSGFANEYRVGAGDLLEIQVIGQADLTQTLRISNTGEISYPHLGVLKVADLSVFDVEAVVAQRLREKGLMQHADVLVSVREYQAKPIYVSGAVVNPGEFIMSQELTVADAILLAGGMQTNAGDEALLHRRASAGGQAWSAAAVAANPDVPRAGMEIVRVDLKPLKEGRFHEVTLPLRRGDVLVVPQQLLNAFFVVGEVVTPRNFSYVPGRTLMASQAISWAGGPTPTAKLSDGMLVRFDAQGQRTEIKVDYSAILKGDQEDFPIQADDIIFIPGSKVKTITSGLLELTDTMVMSYSFRVARTYQMPDASDTPGRTGPPVRNEP
jgi:polysaccharide biosynthesis/export protein